MTVSANSTVSLELDDIQAAFQQPEIVLERARRGRLSKLPPLAS